MFALFHSIVRFLFSDEIKSDVQDERNVQIKKDVPIESLKSSRFISISHIQPIPSSNIMQKMSEHQADAQKFAKYHEATYNSELVEYADKHPNLTRYRYNPYSFYTTTISVGSK